ncbi:hypothetical protein Cni_G00023 [Canna indica]|uniref:Uncharacterized protein n=1 Tax=Canna indica TaxID=4628 RepID=A0AAQ3JKP0_9LILI|nr:hypothetical protein Cni_G00023 [Canna indica]
MVCEAGQLRTNREHFLFLKAKSDDLIQVSMKPSLQLPWCLSYDSGTAVPNIDSVVLVQRHPNSLNIP